MNYIEVLLSCTICEDKKSFNCPTSLRKHYKDHHKITILNVKYENGVKRRLPKGLVEINPESLEKEKYETKLGCPGCYDVFNDLPSSSSHISNIHDLTPEDESTSDEALTNCQSQIKLSLAAEPATVEPTAKIPAENAVNLLYSENN